MARKETFAGSCPTHFRNTHKGRCTAQGSCRSRPCASLHHFLGSVVAAGNLAAVAGTRTEVAGNLAAAAGNLAAAAGNRVAVAGNLAAVAVLRTVPAEEEGSSFSTRPLSTSPPTTCATAASVAFRYSTAMV